MEEKSINIILDTNSHYFLSEFMKHLKVVYGIEEFKFDKSGSTIEGNFEIGFKYKKFFQKDRIWSYANMKFGNIPIGFYCPKCGKTDRVGWNMSRKYLYCIHCNNRLIDYEDKNIILL